MNFIHSYEKDLHKKLKKKLFEKKRALRKMTGSGSDYLDKEEYERALEPSSPNSEKIDKTTLFEDKYSTSSLIKHTSLERSRSEVVRPSFKMTYHASRKDPEVKRMHSDKHDMFNHEIYDATAGRKEMRVMNLCEAYSQYDSEDCKNEVM